MKKINQTPDDRFDEKVMRTAWHETSCSAHCNNMRPEKECNCLYGYILTDIKSLLHSEIDLALEQAAKAVEGMKIDLSDSKNNSSFILGGKEAEDDAETINSALTSAADIIRKLKNK